MLRRLAKEDVWKSVIDILGRAKSTTGSGHVPRMTATQSQVQDLVSILEYFKEATNVLQGDGITSSMIIPAILGVDTSLADSSTGQDTFKLQLRSALQRRFTDILCTPEYVLATMLDPRYKLIPFSADLPTSAVPQGLTPVKTVSVLDAKNMLLEYLRKTTVQSKTVVTPTAEPAVNNDVPRKSIFHKFALQTTRADEREDMRYFAIPVDSEASPTHYWSSNQKEFPCIAQLARKLYCQYIVVLQ